MSEKTHNPFLEPGEKIIIYIDKNIFIYLLIIFITIIVNILPLVVFYWFYTTFVGDISFFVWWLVLWYQIFMISFVYVKFLEEVLDMIIVTNRRIINVDQISFLKREISSARLEDIQDATGTVKGLLAHIFKFGKIVIQTASARVFFTMDMVSRPHEIEDKIIRLTRDKNYPDVELGF